jgi:hypothetical protein
MNHNPDPRSDRDESDTVERNAASPEVEEERAVPTAPAPEPVHRWLDGEKVNPQDLDEPESQKHMQFWSKMQAETERRRRMKTPRGFDSIVMDKLSPPVVKDE